MNTPYCRTCKTIKDIPSWPVASRTNKKGELVKYYRCRPCSAKMQKKFRDSSSGKAFMSKTRKNAYRTNPDKVKARQFVHHALHFGIITKPDICSKCGEGGTIQGHHLDYKKPLEVIWLCRRCHYDVT